MAESIKKIAEFFGSMFSLFFPSSLGELWKATLAHFYTGYVRGKFAKWGKGSVIAYKALRLKSTSYISIAKNVQISKGVQLTAWPPDTKRIDTCLIIIGDDCILREGCHISAANKITIGKNLLTGTNVLITDNSHGQSTKEHMSMPFTERPLYRKGSVVIGDNVWLGNNVCVMPGVTIGNGAIIGANSVVTHDIPTYSVAAGIPAKVIKQL